MTTLLVIVWGLLELALTVVMAVQPKHGLHSWFELRRLSNDKQLQRERLLKHLSVIRRLIIGLLVILTASVAVLIWQGLGIGIAVGAYATAAILARFGPLKHYVAKLYRKYEPTLLDYSEKLPFLGKMHDEIQFLPDDHHLESKEQLNHLVESAGSVLSNDQKSLILNGMLWHDQLVETVMTLQEDIVSVKDSEVLGPLVLSELHLSGHGQIPVIDDSHTVIGMLDVTSLMEIATDKDSRTARAAMTRKIAIMTPKTTLKQALEIFQAEHCTIAIVIDGAGATSGLVTLRDITYHLR